MDSLHEFSLVFLIGNGTDYVIYDDSCAKVINLKSRTESWEVEPCGIVQNLKKHTHIMMQCKRTREPCQSGTIGLKM